MRLPTSRQTGEAAGVDPDAPLSVPEVPRWLETPVEDRLGVATTADTSELPVVETAAI